MNTEHVILINRDDSEIGPAGKLEAHRQGLLHRAFSVFITRGGPQGLEILMQKRHKQKYHSGGLWSNTCCGHPRPGETTKSAAERRLFEEMGLRCSLREIGSFHYEARLGNGLIENELDHVFVGQTESQDFTVNPQEVEEHAWTPIIALSQECQEHPEQFTVWFKPALQVLHDCGNVYG